MKKFAILKHNKVVGYIHMTEEQREILNKTDGINVYIGFDKETRPEMYPDENGGNNNGII